MPQTQIVQVPHLGGIDASYQMPHRYDPKKPTLVLVNSFTTSSELYQKQYENKALTDTMNLLAIELLGHGQTRTKRENWTYWDTAEMNLQVLDALGIEKAFVLGTSQGGWITVRMALLRPEKVRYIDQHTVYMTRPNLKGPVDPRNYPSRNLAGLRIRAYAPAPMLERRRAAASQHC